MFVPLPFVATTQYHFTPLLYSNKHYYKPVRFFGKLCRVGKTSFAMHEGLVCDDSNELLVTSLQNCVANGRESRRPEPHPDWFTQKFKHFNPTNQLFEPYKPASAPSGGEIHRPTYTIAHSDIDYNSHCSNNSYVCFCLDKDLMVPQFEKFANLKLDILNTMYMEECNHGCKVLLLAFRWSFFCLFVGSFYFFCNCARGLYYSGYALMSCDFWGML